MALVGCLKDELSLSLNIAFKSMRYEINECLSECALSVVYFVEILFQKIIFMTKV